MDLNPDVAEAAALAHDLGHPPFGHEAEKMLNELVTRAHVPDGFEGNAQSFRIVTKLSLRFHDIPGLNLTRASLDGILKYPWLRAKGPPGYEEKWGAYNSEAKELEFARELHPKGDQTRSVEAELMDWADDVTYAVHDVEDFYRAGLIPLEQLSSRKEDSERKRFVDKVFERFVAEGKRVPYDRTDLEKLFRATVRYYPDERYSGTQRQRAALRTMTSQLISEFVSAVKLVESAHDSVPVVKVADDSRREVFIWKELTWVYVILNPSLATQHQGQRQIITSLFRTFYKAARSKNLSIFPHFYQEELELAQTEASGPEDLNKLGRLQT